MTNKGSLLTHRGGVALVAVSLFLLPLSVRAQALNACDLNADGKVDINDVNLAVNMALGTAPCTSIVMGVGVCNIVVVQRVTNAAVNGTCLLGSVHTVTLNWTASTSQNVAGYNVYRSLINGGPYTQVNTSLVTGTTYTDNNVQLSTIYYYVLKTQDTSGNLSVYSTQASASIPVS